MKSDLPNLKIQTSPDINQINWFNPTSNLNSKNSSPHSTLENSYRTFTQHRDSDLDQFGIRKNLMAKTKLIASINKNFTIESIKYLMNEGIRIFRLNGELFNHKEYSKIIKAINFIFEQEKLNEKPTIIFDLKGPMPMITKLNKKREDGILHVRKGQVIKLTYDTGNKHIEEDNVICLDKKIAHALKQGDVIHINNTKVVLKVIGFDRYKKTQKFRRNSAADRERLNFNKNKEKIYKNIMENIKHSDKKVNNNKEFMTHFPKNEILIKKRKHSKSDSNLIRDGCGDSKLSQNDQDGNDEIDMLMQKFTKFNRNSNFPEMDGLSECEEEYGDYWNNIDMNSKINYRMSNGYCRKKKSEKKLDPYETFANSKYSYSHDFNKLEKVYNSIIVKKKNIFGRNENSSNEKKEKYSSQKNEDYKNYICGNDYNFVPDDDPIQLDKNLMDDNIDNNNSDPYKFLVDNDFKINFSPPNINETLNDNLQFNPDHRDLYNNLNKWNDYEFLSHKIKLFNLRNSQKLEKLSPLDNIINISNSILSKRQRIKSMNNNFHKYENDCIEKKNNLIVCEVESEGPISEFKKLSLIERDLISSLDTPVIGAKDIIDISKSAELGVNFISCLVNNASNINDIRDLLSEESKKTMRILARIETSEAVYNFNEILEKVDGVIIFHGVFSNRIPISDLIFLESYMIEKCKMHDKIILFQTENIFDNNKKFISELSSIDSMIKEGFDGIILKEEINIDLKNRLNTIKSIKEIIWQCECEIGMKDNITNELYFPRLHSNNKLHQYSRKNSVDCLYMGLDAIFHSAVQASYSIEADIIIFYSEDANLLKKLSKLHPKCLILFPTSDINVSAYLSLIRGVVPFQIDKNIENEFEQEQITQMILDKAKDLNMYASHNEKKIIVVTVYMDCVKKKRNGMFFFVKTT